MRNHLNSNPSLKSALTLLGLCLVTLTLEAAPKHCSKPNSTGPKCSTMDEQAADDTAKKCVEKQGNTIKCERAKSVTNYTCENEGEPLYKRTVVSSVYCHEVHTAADCCDEKDKQPCVTEYFEVKCTTSTQSASCPTTENSSATTDQKYCQKGSPAQPSKIINTDAVLAQDCSAN